MAKAGRIYLQLDVNYHEDPRLVDVTPLAELLYVRCLCQCKKLMNDGVLTNTQINKLGADIVNVSMDEDVPSLMNELVSVGLLEDDGALRYTIRGWASWNRSSEEIEEVSAARSAAGRVGGLASAAKRSKTKQVASNSSSNLLSDTEANETLLVNTETETETETDIGARRKPSKSTTPDTFEITPLRKEWAVKNGYDISVNLETETQNFLDHHAAKGSEMVSWDRAWQKWIRTANGYAQQRKPKTSSFVDGYVPANQMSSEEVKATYAGMGVSEWPSE